MPDGSSVNGATDENGVFTLNQIPVGRVNVVLESGFEKRMLSLNLNGDVVEVSQVFNFSWATILTFAVLLILVLIILPQTRRRIAKAFPIEVSIEEYRSVVSAYLESLSSRGLNVEEALEVGKGEARILLGEGNILPRLKNEVNHAVLLVSDPSFIPPRREVRVLAEASEPEKDLESVSRLVKEYSEKTGLRALGILVCEEVADGLLNLVKGLKDVEVVCATRRSLGV
ncbi:MAG: hypothetical protein ACPL4E_10880 [Thermoproteota archaeon]